jgi:hypothetical protein
VNDGNVEDTGLGVNTGAPVGAEYWVMSITCCHYSTSSYLNSSTGGELTLVVFSIFCPSLSGLQVLRAISNSVLSQQNCGGALLRTADADVRLV